MGMPRSQMLQILNTMSDDSLQKAMAATGIQSGGSAGEGMDFGDESAEGLESWNNREVSVDSSPRPPIVDKSKFEKPAVQQGMRPKYDESEDNADLQQFMPQEGMPEV